MQPDDLGRLLRGPREYEDRRTGVAPECRAVVRDGAHHPIVTLDLLLDLQEAGLKPLDVVGAAEDPALDPLELVVAGRVIAGIAHDHNLAILQVRRVVCIQHERLPALRQAADPEQGHVPVRVDHHYFIHGERHGLGPPDLVVEVHRRDLARVEPEVSDPQPPGEDHGDVPVGHHQVRPHDEAGTRVGQRRKARHVDPPDREQTPLHLGAQRLVGQVVPFLRELVGLHPVAEDVDYGPVVGHDDRFEDEALVRVDLPIPPQGGQALQRDLCLRPRGTKPVRLGHRPLRGRRALQLHLETLVPVDRRDLLQHPSEALMIGFTHDRCPFDRVPPTVTYPRVFYQLLY